MKKITALITVLLAILPFAVTAYATEMDKYTVQKDDTLWIISRKYKVDLDDVIYANPQLNDPNLIYPGEVVNVPLKNSKDGEGIIGASMSDSGDGRHDTRRVKFGAKQHVRPSGGTSTSSFDHDILNLVNNERAEHGLTALSLASDISNIARVKCEDMRDSKYFSHQSPTYGSPFEMLKQFGVTYRAAGENIAKGQKTAAAVMNAWMSSEGHRRNILNAAYKEIGIGYATDASGTAYWTQIFMAR